MAWSIEPNHEGTLRSRAFDIEADQPDIAVDAAQPDAIDPVEEAAASNGRSITTIVRNVLVLVGGLGAYLGVRAVTAGSATSAARNAGRLLEFERALGFEWEADIQQVALDYEWVVSVANWIYSFAYWPVIIATLLYTWLSHRALFRRYRNALFASGLVGLVVFAMFPVAPPRFLSGYVDTVNEAARHNYIAHPSWLINENAALPSFHVGWMALSAVLLFPLLRSHLAKVLLVLPAVLMAAVVVITGNHYLVDVVLGVAISLSALGLIVWRERATRIAR
ncbi:MAG: phosphatase PAP2 family protein [Actinomycetia bacterium]|nr:phosphatase PAP2 family protein [Actinomycetes bacterium]MCP4961071.1 phosphatase PAP2 family protein [Actinomycetes bacterium]